MLLRFLKINTRICFCLKGPEHEEMSMLAVQLATKFLFQVGFRTKKTLRGPATDW